MDIINVLYVDDEDNNLFAFKADFRQNKNLKIFTANNVVNAKEIIKKESIHVVFSDQKMPVHTGVDFFEWLVEHYPHPIRILMSDYTDVSMIIDSINKGQVFRFLTKPWVKEDLELTIEKAYESYKLKEKNNYLMDKLINTSEELEQSETEIKRTESLYRTLARNIPNFAVIIFDSDFKCLLADGSALDKTEFDNVEGKNIKDVLSEDTANSIITFYKTVLEHGETIKSEHFHDGKWFESQFIPIRNEELEIDRGMIVIYETTDIKDMSIELEHNLAELKKANLYLDNFVYAASHDLKSPVANLKALANLWDLPGADKEEILRRIRSGIDILDETLNSLVEIIDIQKNNKAEYSIIDFKNSYQKSLLNLDKHLSYKKPNIKVDFNVRNISYIDVYLRSIIYNLLNNSMKYSNDGKQCKINIKTERRGDYILLSVEDNGMGIDLDTIKKENLFEPFNRFTNKASGRGIGLHLVKSMVEKNGGYIDVESKPGKGTTFKLFLKEY
jgi:signal transduction histidine kinase